MINMIGFICIRVPGFICIQVPAEYMMSLLFSSEILLWIYAKFSLSTPLLMVDSSAYFLWDSVNTIV